MDALHMSIFLTSRSIVFVLAQDAHAQNTANSMWHMQPTANQQSYNSSRTDMCIRRNQETFMTRRT
jgi:hypothetical protein